MRTLYYTAFLALISIASLSAQSLYQDALSLAEILRKDQQKANQELENEPPKLVVIKKRKEVYCVYNKFNPTLPTPASEIENSVDDPFYSIYNEFWENKKSLFEAGYYTIKGFDQSDTIEIKFAKDLSIKIHSIGDSLSLQEKRENEEHQLKIPYDSLLILHNTYRKISIVDRHRKVL
ncbi:MAG: hypothetical protein AAFO82_14440, partial [Bacteroidota bacterium]